MQAERTWLEWLRRTAAAGRPRRELRLGIGDDAALFAPRPGYELAISTDLFVEGVHFLRRRDSPATCGRRSVARAFSDLAAMGAEPLALLTSAALPASLPTSWARQYYRALLDACRQSGARLAGGDVAAAAPGRGGAVTIDLVAVGQLRRGRALRRSGAAPGDRIFVSGTLGLGACGRQLAHGAHAARTAADRRALARYLRPAARWQLGLALAGGAAGPPIASAAIDLSDGLSTDLNHLCRASGVGAVIDAARLPLLPGVEGLRLGLHGGEDYELLFTVAPRRRPRLRTLLESFVLTEIGEIQVEPGVWLRQEGHRRRLTSQGWQHFI